MSEKERIEKMREFMQAHCCEGQIVLTKADLIQLADEIGEDTLNIGGWEFYIEFLNDVVAGG